VAEVRDILLRIRGDTANAESALGGLNRIVNTTTVSIAAAGAAVVAFGEAVERGQAVSELSNAFEKLQTAAGNTGGLDSLRKATTGLVSDMQLMRAANQALLSDLTPDQFLQVASAADALGDSIGVGTVEAMAQLTTMVSTGNERLGKMYGIVIDNEAAEEKYAKSIGTTAKELNELGKKEAYRIALLEKMDEQSRKVAGGTDTVGDAFQRIGASTDNLIDKFSQAINENEELVAAFGALAEAIANIDVGPLIDLFNIVTQIAGISIQPIVSLGEALGNLAFELYDNLGNASVAEQIEEIDSAIEKLNQAGSGRSFLGRSDEFRQNTLKQVEALKVQRAELVELQARMQDAGEQTTKTGEAVEKHGTSTSKATQHTKDLGKELKKTAQEAGNFSDAFDQAGLITEMFFGKQTPANLGQDVYDLIKQTERDAIEAQEAAADAAQRAYENAFSEASDFFGTVITGIVDGDIEDVMKNMLKRRAIEFGADLLAQLALENFGSLFGVAGGGDSFNIGSLLGLAETGATAAGAGTAGVGGASSATLASGGTLAAVALGAYALGTQGYNLYQQYTDNNISGKDLQQGTLSALSPDYAAYSGLNSAFGEPVNQDAADAYATYSIATSGAAGGAAGAAAMGGSVGGPLAPYTAAAAAGLYYFGVDFKAGKDEGQQRRDNVRELLQERGIVDDDYNLDLFGGGSFDIGRENIGDGKKIYNLNGNDELAGFGNLLSTFAGGGGEMPDLAAMFANALSEADSFNAAMLTTVGILEDMGLTIEDVKLGLTQAFLDGAISIEQFNAQLTTANALNVESAGSLEEAFELVGDTIDGKPRDSLKAWGLFFQEIMEAGIQDTEGLYSYIESVLGADAVEVFVRLNEAGINQFTDFSTLSSEQIALLFSEVEKLLPIFESLGYEIKRSGDAIEEQTSRMRRGIASVGEEARKTKEEIKGISINHLK
jgi:hypothetical protein